METCQTVAATTETLSQVLASIFAASRDNCGRLTVIDREPNIFASTFPTEIATCQLPDGSMLRVFCKHGTRTSDGSHGHRGSVEYEATVYRQVLSGLGITAPKFYGAYPSGRDDSICLVIEYLDQASRVHYVDSATRGRRAMPTALKLAARWIGEFHKNTARLDRKTLPFLHELDAQYYLDWARRTREFAYSSRRELRWLTAVCERFGDFVPFLSNPPLAIIHGEYYPDNILVQDGKVFPVDWQSAAIGRGEIDLVSLEEGWPESYACEFESEYAQARCPDGAPRDFEKALQAARLYWPLRWLGEPRGWEIRSTNRRYLSQLRRVATNLDIIN